MQDRPQTRAKSGRMKEIIVKSGKAEFAVTAAGEGRPLVFLHAGVCDRRMWRAQVAAFAATDKVIAYDRRGFGQTTYAAEPHSATGDLTAVLDATTAGEPVTLVGCSQGGRIAIDFALRNPTRVRTLVLVAPAVGGAPWPDKFPEPIQRLVDAMTEAEKRNDLDRLNALEAHAWLDGPAEREGRVGGAARALFLDMNGRVLRSPETGDAGHVKDAYARFAELAMPITFISGLLDFPNLNETSRRLSRAAPKASLVEVHGVAHLPNLERPDFFNTLLRKHFERAG